MVTYIKKHLSNIEAHFMKKLSNTERLSWKKALLIKKCVYLVSKQPLMDLK